MKTKSAMTLDRVLSRFGLASRTTAREQIRAGRVKVNGRITRDPDAWVRPAVDPIHLDGKRLRPARKIYLLFYKPKGVITSHGDPGARDTIYDFLDGGLPWVAPVGRLDKDTSGLLLLTNDTDQDGQNPVGISPDRPRRRVHPSSRPNPVGKGQSPGDGVRILCEPTFRAHATLARRNPTRPALPVVQGGFVR